jgi:hypothetical protein
MPLGWKGICPLNRTTCDCPLQFAIGRSWYSVIFQPCQPVMLRRVPGLGQERTSTEISTFYLRMWRYPVVIFLAAALAVAFRYLKQMHIAFAVVIVLACAPVLAWLCAPIVMDLVSRLVEFSDRSARGALQGKYYTFDARRIRFFVVDETIWVAESDLAGILVQAMTEAERRHLDAEYGVVPGKRFRGFTEDGITRLLATRLKSRHVTRQVIRFNQWLRNEAFPNVRRLPSSGL